MSMLPFPADSAEFEEYTSVMEEMADEAQASTPDPEPCDDDDEQGGEDSHLDAYWESRYDDGGYDDGYSNYGHDFY